jgi:predicted Zn-dependent peptidase
VEKEKGIIAQEIKMYQDLPDQQIYYALLRAMYQRYPLNIDVAGTVESIYQITKDDLYLCYNTFYHPSNMILIVVGGVEPEPIMEVVRSNQAAKNYPAQGPIRRQFDPEPVGVKEHEIVKYLQVSMPKCYFGFKGTRFFENPSKRLREETVMELLFDTLLSNSSPLYHALYDKQLITDSFGCSYGNNPQYAYSMLGGESKDPDAMIAGVMAGLAAAARDGLSTEDFERARRKKMGRFLRVLDSPETMSSYLYEFFSEGIDPLAGVLPLYESIQQEEALAMLRTAFDPGQMAVSKVLPQASK